MSPSPSVRFKVLPATGPALDLQPRGWCRLVAAARGDAAPAMNGKDLSAEHAPRADESRRAQAAARRSALEHFAALAGESRQWRFSPDGSRCSASTPIMAVYTAAGPGPARLHLPGTGP